MRSLVLYKFVRLAPASFIIILIGGIFGGLLQSLTIFSLLPLTELLGIGSESAHWFSGKSQLVIERVGLPYSLPTVLVFMVIFVTLVAASQFLIRAYSAKVAARIVRQKRMTVLNGITQAEWSWLSNKSVGDWIHSLVTEAGKVSAGYIDCANFAAMAGQSLVLLLSAFALDWRLALGGFLGGGIIIAGFYRWMEKARILGSRAASLLNSVTRNLAGGLGGLKQLKAMSRQDYLRPLLSEEIKEIEKYQYRLYLVSGLPELLREPLIVILLAIGLAVIVPTNLIPVETVVPGFILLQRGFKLIGATQGSYQSIKKMEPYLESFVDRSTQALEHRETRGGTAPARFNQSVRLVGVDFAYGQISILMRANVTIKKGDLTVVIAPSGIGKTTLLDLIAGLQVPTRGHVMVDDTPLSELDTHQWRRKLGYVPQEAFIFGDSVKNNICLGDDGIDDKAIWTALQKAGLEETVARWPNKLDTKIGERGALISGGQQQRLAIARALVKRPELLIMDEPTSALDQKTSCDMLASIKDLTTDGLTTIVASHDQLVIGYADRVLEIVDGKVKEV
jgi:ATP-binding cassette, subfamily C, bacterial